MKYITLGKTNEKVSIIGLGSWSYGKENISNGSSVGWAGQSDSDSISALKKSFSMGINHWDTADVYGEGYSEKIIGSLWKELPRAEIFLATKIGWDMGPYKNWYNPKHMRTNFEKSLINLKTDCVDLLYLHHCNFGKLDEYLDDAVDTINRFKEEGKTKFIGLSDWSSSRILKFIEIVKPDVIQPLYNVYDRDYIISGLNNYVNNNNIGVCYFSPIKHGLLTGKYESIPTFPKGDFRENVKEFKNSDFINKMQTNKIKLEEKFSSISKEPVLHGLTSSILFDNPTACVLLGQRNQQQAICASKLGQPMSKKESEWVFSLYN